MFRQRERQLEPANQAEDEEEMDDEEEEDDEEGVASGGQRLTKEEDGEAEAKDAESDAQSDRSRSRSRSASRSKSKSPRSASSAASSSRSRSSSSASSRRSASPAPAAVKAADKKYKAQTFLFAGIFQSIFSPSNSGVVAVAVLRHPPVLAAVRAVVEAAVIASELITKTRFFFKFVPNQYTDLFQLGFGELFYLFIFVIWLTKIKHEKDNVFFTLLSERLS